MALGGGGLGSGGGGGGGVPDSPLILQGFGVVGAPELAFLGDEDTGLYRPAADQLGLVAGGVEGLRVSETGAVITVQAFGNIQMSNTSGPQLFNAAGTDTIPSLVPSRADPNTGFSAPGGDNLNLIAGSVRGFRVAESASVITNTIFGNLVADGGGGAGPMMKNEGPSSTNPTFVPNQADPDTGLGRDTVDGLSLIAGGVGCLRVREIGGARAVGLYTTTPIVQQTGVAVSAAGIHAACVALGLFTA